MEGSIRVILESTRNLAAVFGAAALATAPLPGIAAAKTIKVTTTIQAAVNLAQPGDTVMVPPGTYHESVQVTTSNLTIKSGNAAVLDASGNDYGIVVGDQSSGGPPLYAGCPPVSVRNFTLDGLTIQNADDTGILLVGVDTFRVTNGTYLNNAEYGVFPRCSRNGRIDHNSGGGGAEATVYVGIDDTVVVEQNTLTQASLGIELENTDNTFVRNNKISDNIGGIVIIVQPDLPHTSTEHAVIENNVVTNNNLPNPLPPPPPLIDADQLLPSGTGILNAGGHDIVIRNNVVMGNNTFGIALVANPLDNGPPEDTEVRNNTVIKNGAAPDPRAGLPGSDILYDGSGSGNCFANNNDRVEVPPGIVAAFPCARK